MRTEEIRTHSKLISVIPSQSSLRKAASVCSHSAHATPGIAPHAAERKAATRDAHATWHGVLSHMGAAQAVRLAEGSPQPSRPAARPPGSDAQ